VTARKLLVAGARQFSLGHAVLQELATTSPDLAVLAIDVEPILDSPPSIIKCRIELNPFRYDGGFDSWSSYVHGEVKSLAQIEGPSRPIQGVLLAVGKYHVGRYEESAATERADVLGCGILGKMEVVHSAMRFNNECGFENREELFVLDVGSLHSIRHSSHRAIYNTAKAAGIEFCRVLARGSEIRGAVHLAPGPMDTPMLHWNHWVLKEKGDPNFLDLVRLELPALYCRIFREGDQASLEEAVENLGVDRREIQPVFDRYRDRRKMALESEDGITAPEVLARFLLRSFLDASSTESGILEVTSPRGQMSVIRKPF